MRNKGETGVEYNHLYNLKPSDYMYPGEDNAFNLIRKVPLWDKLMNEYMGFVISSNELPNAQADYYRVTEKSCKHVHDIFELAKARLDIQQDIPLFIKPDFDFNASAYGGGSPFIIIHSSFVKNCSDEELLFILGHELGHIKGEHLIGKRMVIMLSDLIGKTSSVGALISSGLILPLYDWMRMMEFSADRAGAIAAGSSDNALQGVQLLLGVHDKLAHVHVTQEDLLTQHESYQTELENPISKLLITLELLTSSHPWSVDRIYEMNKWKESGEFEKLIAEKAQRSEAKGD